jgi:DNA-binding transcriptional regulator YiaG
MDSISNESQLLLAIEALKQRPKLSIRAAARIYNVSRDTLQRRRNHIQSRRNTTPNCRKLTDLEESTLFDTSST